MKDYFAFFAFPFFPLVTFFIFVIFFALTGFFAWTLFDFALAFFIFGLALIDLGFKLTRILLRSAHQEDAVDAADLYFVFFAISHLP
jgi:hypothetical protein